MEQEKDKYEIKKSKVQINFREIEELMNLLDPHEEIFLSSKSLVKEMKSEYDRIAARDDENTFKR